MEELIKNKNVVKLGRRYFLDDKKLMDFCRQKGIKPFSVGRFIGEERNGKFIPSPGILSLMKNYKRVKIDDKASWLFTCGRDIFNKSVVDFFSAKKKEMVVVQNPMGELLGLGIVDKDIVKNVMDVGDFLRRER